MPKNGQRQPGGHLAGLKSKYQQGEDHRQSGTAEQSGQDGK